MKWPLEFTEYQRQSGERDHRVRVRITEPLRCLLKVDGKLLFLLRCHRRKAVAQLKRQSALRRAIGPEAKPEDRGRLAVEVGTLGVGQNGETGLVRCLLDGLLQNLLFLFAGRECHSVPVAGKYGDAGPYPAVTPPAHCTGDIAACSPRPAPSSSEQSSPGSTAGFHAMRSRACGCAAAIAVPHVAVLLPSGRGLRPSGLPR